MGAGEGIPPAKVPSQVSLSLEKQAELMLRAQLGPAWKVRCSGMRCKASRPGFKTIEFKLIKRRGNVWVDDETGTRQEAMMRGQRGRRG